MPNNKNDIKVLTKKSYKLWKLIHDVIFFGVPLVYLIVFYELFKKTSTVPASTKITAWGWFAIIVLMAFFKSIIFNIALDINKNFSIVGKRITKTMVLGMLSVAILFSSLWIKHLVLLLLVFCVSMTLSVFPLYKYIKNKEHYDFVKDIQKTEDVKSQINQGKLRVK